MTLNSDEFEIDPQRLSLPFSGIPVRARYPSGKYGAADLTQLSRGSLFRWLRSRGGANLWAENTVALLLGHQPQEDQ